MSHSVLVTQQTARESACRRTALRRRVVLTAVLMTPTGVHNVRVRDISTEGARLHGSSKIPINCDAVLKRGELFVAARVVWADGWQCGLHFYQALTPDELDRKLAL